MRVSTVAYRVIFSGEPPVGTLEFVSDECAALIGTDAGTIVDRPAMWLEAIHEDDRDAFVQTTAQLIVNGEPVVRHYRLRLGSSDIYQLVEDRLSASLDADGDVVGYEASITKAN